MEQHKGIMKAEWWCRDSIVALEAEIFELRQTMFKKEELLWEQQRLLHRIQRSRIERFKKLSENQRIALRSGLSLVEVELAKRLLQRAAAKPPKEAF